MKLAMLFAGWIGGVAILSAIFVALTLFTNGPIGN